MRSTEVAVAGRLPMENQLPRLGYRGRSWALASFSVDAFESGFARIGCAVGMLSVRGH